MRTSRLCCRSSLLIVIVFLSDILGFSSVHGWMSTVSPFGRRPVASATSRSLVSVLFAKSGKKKKSPKSNVISVNRIAYRNFDVLETLEAGIALKGTEVKALRDGKLQLRDGYIKASPSSLILLNVHIGKNDNTGAYFQHEERRPRQLLVHSAQARKLYQQTSKTKGMTIVPLKAYFSEANFVKLQIGLCRGKNVRDKRADIQARDNKREEQRIIKSFRVGI